MNFFKQVGNNLGNLLLDSDSEDEDSGDEATTTKRTNEDGEGDDEKKRRGKKSTTEGGDEAGVGDGDSDESSEADSEDEPLIPEAVWGALAVARGKIAQVARHTVETVKRDLGEFKDSVREDALVVGEVVSEHTAHVNDPEFREGIATTAHDAFEATTDVLEEVGQKVEKFGSSVFRGAGELFAQLKESVDAVESSSSAAGESHASRFRTRGAGLSGSRFTTRLASNDKGQHRRGSSAAAAPSFEHRVQTMQRDSGTYCDEPDDVEDFEAWRANFALDAKSSEVEEILVSNSFMRELQSRIVPLVVEYDAFWTRYFYRLHMLKVEFGVIAAPSSTSPTAATAAAEAAAEVDAEAEAEAATAKHLGHEEADEQKVTETETGTNDERGGDGDQEGAPAAAAAATGAVGAEAAVAAGHVIAATKSTTEKENEKTTTAVDVSAAAIKAEEKLDSHIYAPPAAAEHPKPPNMNPEPEVDVTSTPTPTTTPQTQSLPAAEAAAAAATPGKSKKGKKGKGEKADSSDPPQSKLPVIKSSAATIAKKAAEMEETPEPAAEVEETPEEMSKSGVSIMSLDTAGSDSPKTPSAERGTHRRVTQVSTDEEALEWTSDDSVGKEWTAVKSSAGEGVKGERAAAAHTRAVEKHEAKSPNKGKGGKSPPASSTTTSDKKPPLASGEAPVNLSILDDDDDDIDEDWGMD